MTRPSKGDESDHGRYQRWGSGVSPATSVSTRVPRIAQHAHDAHWSCATRLSRPRSTAHRHHRGEPTPTTARAVMPQWQVVPRLAPVLFGSPIGGRDVASTYSGCHPSGGGGGGISRGGSSRTQRPPLAATSRRMPPRPSPRRRRRWRRRRRQRRRQWQSARLPRRWAVRRSPPTQLAAPPLRRRQRHCLAAPRSTRMEASMVFRARESVVHRRQCGGGVRVGEKGTRRGPLVSPSSRGRTGGRRQRRHQNACVSGHRDGAAA